MSEVETMRVATPLTSEGCHEMRTMFKQFEQHRAKSCSASVMNHHKFMKQLPIVLFGRLKVCLFLDKSRMKSKLSRVQDQLSKLFIDPHSFCGNFSFQRVVCFLLRMGRHFRRQPFGSTWLAMVSETSEKNEKKTIIFQKTHLVSR